MTGCMALSGELELDAAVDETRRLGRERDLGRRAGRGAGADVEAALVQRALDLVAFEKAVAQARVAVGADVVGGEDGAVDEVERDLAAADARRRSRRLAAKSSSVAASIQALLMAAFRSDR